MTPPHAPHSPISYLWVFVGDRPHPGFVLSFFLSLRVEFLLKTESGYLRDAEVTFFASVLWWFICCLVLSWVFLVATVIFPIV